MKARTRWVPGCFDYDSMFIQTLEIIDERLEKPLCLFRRRSVRTWDYAAEEKKPWSVSNGIQTEANQTGFLLVMQALTHLI